MKEFLAKSSERSSLEENPQKSFVVKSPERIAGVNPKWNCRMNPQNFFLRKSPDGIPRGFLEKSRDEISEKIPRR